MRANQSSDLTLRQKANKRIFQKCQTIYLISADLWNKNLDIKKHFDDDKS